MLLVQHYCIYDTTGGSVLERKAPFAITLFTNGGAVPGVHNHVYTPHRSISKLQPEAQAPAHPPPRFCLQLSKVYLHMKYGNRPNMGTKPASELTVFNHTS